MPRPKDDTEAVRALARHFTEDEVYALGWAADLAATVLGQADRPFPDPDKRVMAQRLRNLSATIHRANVVRDFIDESGE